MKTVNLARTWDSYKIALVGLSLIATGFFLWLMRQYGASSTPDSAAYLSVAAHLLQGQGYLMYDSSPLTLWPPFYPILLAVLSRITGAEPYAVASVLNAFIFGFTVYLSGILFLHHLKSPWLALAGTAAVMLSAALLWDTLMALTDALYCFLTLVYLLCFEKYANSARLIWILLAAVAVMLACLSRYAAMIMIPIGVASIVLFAQGSIRSKIVPIVLFCIVSGLPYLRWVMHVYELTGSPFGPRGLPEYTLPEAINTALFTVFTWYAPQELVKTPVGILFLAIGVGLLIWFLRHRWANLVSAWAGVGDLIFYIVVYTSFLVYSGITSYVSPLDNRLLSPIFAPITLLVLLLIEKIAETATVRVSPRLVGLVVGIAVVASLLYATGMSYNTVRVYLDEGGIGFTDTGWRNNTTILYVAQHPETVKDCTLYTNAPDALYLVARVQARWLPTRETLGKIQADAVQGKFPYQPVMCIVWLDGLDRPQMLGESDLKPMASVQLRGQFQDGAVYALTKKSS